MIQGEADDEEIEQLEEASALKDIAHMPARVKCAVLGWHTLEEALKNFDQFVYLCYVKRETEDRLQKGAYFYD